jgi:hypothetical protein
MSLVKQHIIELQRRIDYNAGILAACLLCRPEETSHKDVAMYARAVADDLEKMHALCAGRPIAEAMTVLNPHHTRC